jgi:3-methyl-2-oxobutanoate hydroxymethyltransferase
MKRLTIRDIQKMKQDQKPIVMLTAYDAVSAKVAERAGVPVLLVGDTLGMVVQGHESTIPVRLEHMIYHCEIVSRVTNTPLIVCDLPFLTYQVSVEQALINAARLLQEGGATCVKLEGGATVAPTIRRIVDAGIPVMAHIGLTPQSVNQIGGFRVQGKQAESAKLLIQDAEAVQEAGAFAVVLELVPDRIAAFISQRLRIPTIGIGAGAGCDGQVQVFHDILGLYDEFVPRHTQRYTEAGKLLDETVRQYREQVEGRQFPTRAHSFEVTDEVMAIILKEFDGEDH